MHIDRPMYMDELVSKERNGLVKIITGIRRCGKSYLLFEMFCEHLRLEGVSDERIIRIALDDRANKALRDPDACYDFVRSRVQGDEWHYVLLDEVQMMDEFEDVLNGLLHLGNVDVYVTGSNSRFLSSDIITEFRGRGDQVRLHPLTFSEFRAAVGGDWEDAWESYVTFGGLPHVTSLDTNAEKAEYLTRLFDEVYLRDVVGRNSVRNEAQLSELVDVLASTVGSLTNPHKLEATFRSKERSSLSAATIKSYIGYLEDAFLVSAAKRYDVKGRRYIGTPLKYYFEDVGLRNARLNFRQQEETHLMENVIYNELVARGYQVDVGVVELSERDETRGRSVQKPVEIDFVANLGPQRCYIQSAFALPTSDKRAQEIRPLLGTRDGFRKIIVVGGRHRPTIDDNGIVTMGLREFLLDPNSIMV